MRKILRQVIHAILLFIFASGVTMSGGCSADIQGQISETHASLPAGSMATARSGHTATLLPNGMVLVAGGVSSSGYAAITELYNPVNNTWSAAGSLVTARFNHTATLLPNGMVLVAGGQNGNELTSAELYNPTTNAWSSAGSMSTGRYDHTATLLSNGTVLVAGGLGAGGNRMSAELYNPATNAWSAAANMGNARSEHTATLLTNGIVLVAGGGQALATAELYDPSTNTWSVTGSMATGRAGHTASLLPDGRVLVAAGMSSGSSGYFYLANAELYDPKSNIWSDAGAMDGARSGQTATLRTSGSLVILGGVNGATGSNYYYANAQMYNSPTNSWVTAGSLITGRSGHTATLLLNGMILIAGGEGSGNYVGSAELYW